MSAATADAGARHGGAPRIAFLTTHLAGTGHFVRTLALARAALTAGARVRVITGGRPLAHIEAGGIDVVQIPPLMVRGLDFATMLRPDGSVAGEADLAARRDAIGAALADLAPDALVTELFPLGRRRLAAEFEHAIAAARGARPGVAIIASVRDVPEPPSKPARIDEAAARLARYDAVLVHGQASFLPLSASWPLPEPAAALVRHTGYVGVDPGAAAKAEEGTGEAILVAVGGGDRGRGLLELAAAAAGHSARPWHLLVGGADAAAVAADLARRRALPRLTVEPARADYPTLLARAAASVSLCGYNTAMDLAATTTPALLVPDETAGEQEQLIRARALAGFEGVAMQRLETLDPPALAAAAEALAEGSRRKPMDLARDGAARAAAAILETVAAKARP